MGSATSGYAQLTPSQRTLASTVAIHTRWSKANSPEARRAGTQAARDGRRRKLEQKVLDAASGPLSPGELAAAVERLQKAHQSRMTLASALARSGKAAPQDRRGAQMVPPPRMVRADSATPSELRTSGPRGGNPAAGARAQRHTSALAEAG